MGRPPNITRVGALPALTLCALLASPGFAAALDPAKQIAQYVHLAWDSERGLPQNSVTAVVQTADGYIWLGTQEGLVRFDGVRFTVFDRRSRAIPHNYVTALLVSRQGSLWIGTNDGGVTRYTDGQFHDSPLSQQRSITSFAEQANGTLWIGTQENGVFRCLENACQAFTTADGLPSNRVQALASDATDRIWIATLHGVARSGVVQGGPAIDVVLPGVAGRALAQDRRGGLWIATDRGLFRTEHEKVVAAPMAIDCAPAADARTLLLDRDGSIWTAAAGFGSRRAATAAPFAPTRGWATTCPWRCSKMRKARCGSGPTAAG
jgi:ligand-binding sensor domain-containing protein